MTKQCCVCKNTFEESSFFYNAKPYADGKCCMECNTKFVVPARCGDNFKKLVDIETYRSVSLERIFKKGGLFAEDIIFAIHEFFNYNWGDVSEEQKQLNDNAVRNSNGTIAAKYMTSKGYVYVVTDFNINETEIMLVNEFISRSVTAINQLSTRGVR